MDQTTVLLCRCATHKCLDKIKVCSMEAALSQDSTVDLRMVDDLCGLMAEAGAEDRAAEQSEHIIACFPRAVRGLLNRTRRKDSVPDLHNLRTTSVADILQALSIPPPEEIDEVPGNTPSESVAAPGWFPVIDYERCTHCGQCMSFCLFNVYTKDADAQVVVAAPQNCKDNCPACARICPEVAIMFPKVSEAPINGDEVQDELLEREKAQIALQQSGVANLHGFLTARNRAHRKPLVKPEVRQRILGHGERGDDLGNEDS